MTKAFISHSSKDTRFSRKLAELLAELGVNVWIDVADIRGGTNWGDEIQWALDDCDLMLLVISPDSMASVNVKREWQYFLGEQKLLIPVFIRPAKIPYQLYGLQYVDFFHRTFIAAFAELCMALKSRGFRVGSSSKQRPVFESGAPYTFKSPIAGQLITIGDDISRKPLLASGVATAQDALPILPPPAQGIEIAAAQPRIIPAKRGSVEAILPPPFEWVEISDGEQTLLDGRLAHGNAFPLPTYRISRYPITNAQYQVFVEAPDGYRDEAWWNYSNGARRWRLANPYPRQPGFPGGDHPRTQVCWYEAVAFCRWLAFRVGAQQTIQQITLPTVQQWHWTAVADTGWPYPWGERFVRRYCNTAEGGIRQTTPVTQYRWGESGCGVMDLCGNCWEWCLNDWVSGSDDIHHEAEYRFTLGGSWQEMRDFACVQHQPCRKPGARRNTQGFRIAAAFSRL